MSRERGISSMPWFRMNSAIYADADIRELTSSTAGLRAFRLFVFSIGWSVQTYSAGHIPKTMLELLGGTKRDAIALIESRLWEYAEGGYRIRAFDEWQELHEDRELKRQLAKRNACVRWMKEGKPCKCGQH
jgi:hypothetical protein